MSQTKAVEARIQAMSPVVYHRFKSNVTTSSALLHNKVKYLNRHHRGLSRCMLEQAKTCCSILCFGEEKKVRGPPDMSEFVEMERTDEVETGLVPPR